MRTDLIVVGAGPAGLAAAAAASEAGLAVAVVDERTAPGGSVAGPLGASARDPEAAWTLPVLVPDADARARVDRLAAASAGVTLVLDAFAWGIFPGWTVAVARGGRTERWDADQVVLATGGYVARLPFVGHELAGAVTPLGLVRALEAGDLAPDARVAVWGDDPLADAVETALTAHGVASVARLVERPRPTAGSLHVLAEPPIARAGGDGRLAAIDLTLAGGDRHTLDVDWLVVADRATAATELAVLAGCDHRFDGYASGFRPVHGADGATSVAGVYVAGELAGAHDTAAAERSGALAGLAAAVRAGRAPGERLAARLAVRTAAPVARAALVPDVLRRLDPDADALACHCVGVSCAVVSASIRDGARSLDDVKRQAKAGMGPCQGRDCHRAVVRLLDVVGGVDVGTLRPMRGRPPVRPLPARALYEGEVPA